VTTVLLVRHGLTATTGHVLTGWTPGIPLDDRGRDQAAALAARLAPLPLDAIVSSPLERCRQTAAAVAATRDGQQIITDDRVGECRYGDWTGQPLKKLAREQLWRVVQAHPSAVTFPGPGGESMPDMQHRAVAAVREWNARLGKDATYLICSHGDVIKAIVADSLGLHLDQCQRIQADPCSLTVIRYTPLRPFLVRMNDRGGGVDDLMPRARDHDCARDSGQSDAAVGGGSGGVDPQPPQPPENPEHQNAAESLADRVNGASGIPAGATAASGPQSPDTRG
jgi:probable phosphomutase (TIGR03848 family)